ncbi:hypothetical protein ACQP2F_02550 [Actinoplanes sp. CA-030573]|uniref:hypothetical protein n=1 Tax=Actinoplanes sp. CA-030573 TaxID=3239898 RepID=UPI003D8DA4B2
MAVPAPASGHADPTVIDVVTVAAATGQEIATRGEKAVAKRAKKAKKPKSTKKAKKPKNAGSNERAAARKYNLQKHSLPKDDPNAFYTLDWGTTWRRVVLDWLGPAILLVIASVLTIVACVLADDLGLDVSTVLKAMGLATSSVMAGAIARVRLRKKKRENNDVGNNEKSNDNETAENKSPDDKS